MQNTHFFYILHFFIIMFQYIKHVMCINFVYIGNNLEKLFEIYIFWNSGKHELLRKVPTACLFFFKNPFYFLINTEQYIKHVMLICLCFLDKIWKCYFEIYIVGISGKYEILRKIPSECLFLIKYYFSIHNNTSNMLCV